MMMMVQTISSKVNVMFALHRTKAIQVILWKHKQIIFIKNPFGWQCINRMYVDTKYIPQNTCISSVLSTTHTVYPKTYAHGFCFAVLCCDYTLTDFPISIRLTSLALWQSNDCPSASKATLMNMDKYFMWIHYERLHNHNKAEPPSLGRIRQRVLSQFWLGFAGPWDILTQKQAVCLWGQSCEGLGWCHIARLFHRLSPSQRRDQLPVASEQRHPGDIYQG